MEKKKVYDTALIRPSIKGKEKYCRVLVRMTEKWMRVENSLEQACLTEEEKQLARAQIYEQMQQGKEDDFVIDLPARKKE